MHCLFLLACERASFGASGSRLCLLPVDILALIVGLLLPRRQRKRMRDRTAHLFSETRALREEFQERKVRALLLASPPSDAINAAGASKA